MLPIINLGGLEIKTYYIAMALGVVLMAILMVTRQKTYNLKTWQSLLFVLLITISGIFSAKMLYIIESWNHIKENGLSIGGFSFFGAFYFVPPFMALMGLLFHLKPFQSANAASICGAAQLGMMRFGCFLNGCCGGKECVIGHTTFNWPAPLMESTLDFIALFILLKLEQKGVKRTYPYAFMFYGVIRFIMEFFRLGTPFFCGLTEGQLFSVGAIVIGLTVLIIEKNKIKKEKLSEI